MRSSPLTGCEFDPRKEVAALRQLYASSRADQLSFVNGLTAEALGRPVANPWAPELKGTVEEVLMQTLLHTQNHRG